MSSFLQHLIARSHGHADVVQPLIAPRFAAPGPESREQIREHVGAHEPRAERAVELPDDVPPTHSVQVAHTLPEAVPAVVPPRATPAAPPPALAAQLPVVDQPRPGEPPRGVAHLAAPNPHGVQPAAQPVPAPAPHLVQPMSQPAQPPGAARVAVQPRQPAVVAPQHLARAADRAPRALIEPAPQAEPRGESRPAAARLAPDQPDIPVAQAVPAAPTIQVTIGRIEVRAVPPPAAPQRSAARPGPALSLDDYLRGRNGGGR